PRLFSRPNIKPRQFPRANFMEIAMRFSFRGSALVAAACLLLSNVAAPAVGDDWPQWRGPHRTGLSDEKGLVHQWPADGPQKLWEVETVGVGYSSMAVKDGLILTQGDLDGVEHIICLKVDDGSTVWAVQ